MHDSPASPVAPAETASLVRLASRLAIAAIALLVVMVSITLVTGVAQEPFELVRPLDAYVAALSRGTPALRLVLAADTLFVGVYAALFVTLAALAAPHGTRPLLRLGLYALLGTALLDIVEDQHLFALTRAIEAGDSLTPALLRAQHTLSQSKFHLSYVGLFLFGLGLPRRDAFERAFSAAIALPLPLLGALLWIAPPTFEMPLNVARWGSFLAGFALTLAWLARRGSRLTSLTRLTRDDAAPSRGALARGSGAPA